MIKSIETPKDHIIEHFKNNITENLKWYDYYWYSTDGFALLYFENIPSPPNCSYLVINFIKHKYLMVAYISWECSLTEQDKTVMGLIENIFSPNSKVPLKIEDYLNSIKDTDYIVSNLVSSISTRIINFSNDLKRNPDFIHLTELKKINFDRNCKQINEAVIKYLNKKLIPDSKRGRYKDPSEIDNEVIKKEYEKLVDELEKFFQKKKYKEFIIEQETPTSKHLKITNLARLHDILKEFPPSKKYNSDIFDELKQRVKQWQRLEQSYKSSKKTKAETKMEVEEKLQTKLYPINTNKGLAKHILSIKYNKGYPAIDKIV